MKVAFAIADLPPVRAIDAVRASGTCADLRFLTSPCARDLAPFGGAAGAQVDAFRPTRAGATAVGEAGTAIGAGAEAIAARLKAEAPAHLLRQVDLVILCTAGFGSGIGRSLAGKVKHILGVPRALAFAIGQMDGCCAFEALRIARAFMAGPDQARAVALLAFDAWWDPYLRSFGDYAHYGDGAAALLLAAPALPDPGSEVVATALGRFQDQRGPYDLAAPRWFEDSAWPQAVGAFLAGFLRQHDATGAGLAAIHSPCLEAAFVAAVGRAAGLDLAPGSGGFVSSVDPLLAWCGPGAAAPSLSMTWSVGLNGEMGACLHRCCGPATAVQP